jgi:hypothetical protein
MINIVIALPRIHEFTTLTLPFLKRHNVCLRTVHVFTNTCHFQSLGVVVHALKTKPAEDGPYKGAFNMGYVHQEIALEFEPDSMLVELSDNIRDILYLGDPVVCFTKLIKNSFAALHGRVRMFGFSPGTMHYCAKPTIQDQVGIMHMHRGCVGILNTRGLDTNIPLREDLDRVMLLQKAGYSVMRRYAYQVSTREISCRYKHLGYTNMMSIHPLILKTITAKHDMLYIKRHAGEGSVGIRLYSPSARAEARQGRRKRTLLDDGHLEL